MWTQLRIPNELQTTSCLTMIFLISINNVSRRLLWVRYFHQCCIMKNTKKKHKRIEGNKIKQKCHVTYIRNKPPKGCMEVKHITTLKTQWTFNNWILICYLNLKPEEKFHDINIVVDDDFALDNDDDHDDYDRFSRQ